MQAVNFPEANRVYAEHQPEYERLPAHIDKRDPHGTLTCCWRLTWRERLAVLFRGALWHQVLTFHRPLQPQLLAVDKPELPSL